MCKIYYFVWNLCYTASIIILTAIAAERYIAIKYPLRARRCLTSRRITMSQIIIWFVAAVYSIPYLIIFDTFSVSDFDGTKLEYCFYKYELLDMKVFATVNFIVWYSLPLILMSIMYSNIVANYLSRSWLPVLLRLPGNQYLNSIENEVINHCTRKHCAVIN